MIGDKRQKRAGDRILSDGNPRRGGSANVKRYDRGNMIQTEDNVKTRTYGRHVEELTKSNPRKIAPKERRVAKRAPEDNPIFRYIFFQDTSGSMRKSDNEGVYEILEESDLSVNVGFMGNEFFLHWFSFALSVPETEEVLGYELTDPETGEEITPEEVREERLIVGVTIDTVVYYDLNDQDFFDLAEERFSQLEVFPILFAEAEGVGKGSIDPEWIAKTYTPNIYEALKVVTYNRGDSVESKAELFLSTFEEVANAS